MEETEIDALIMAMQERERAAREYEELARKARSTAESLRSQAAALAAEKYFGMKVGHRLWVRRRWSEKRLLHVTVEGFTISWMQGDPTDEKVLKRSIQAITRNIKKSGDAGEITDEFMLASDLWRFEEDGPPDVPPTRKLRVFDDDL